jgi:transcriptional regulator of arginine metabolism
MNKGFRQGQILRIVGNKEFFTQEELARELSSVGIQTTQVTLSRDIRDLGLVKTAEGYRVLPAEESGPALADVVAEFMQDIRAAQNLVVVKTSPGNANSLAIAIDKEALEEVVGTVAGDDTILVITPDMETAAKFRQKLLQLISEPAKRQR